VISKEKLYQVVREKELLLESNS